MGAVLLKRINKGNMSEEINHFLKLAEKFLTEETYRRILFDIEKNIGCIIDIGVGNTPGTQGMADSWLESKSHNTFMSSFL